MKVLVIAAHPDDEVFGCYGTLVNHIRKGDSVSVVTLTDGVSSRENLTNTEAGIRNEAFIKSCELIGVKEYMNYSFPDNKMDTAPLLDITKTIEKHVDTFMPEIVYTHFYNDLNIDHRITSSAVLTACRPQPGSCVKEIRMFEIVSSTDWNSGEKFNPNLFVEVTDSYLSKEKALEIYNKELRGWPHQRSKEAIKNLAKVRGAQVGVEVAEAFMIYRRIE